MKTTNSLSMAPVPTLFQIAAFFEDFFPSRRIVHTPTVDQLPIAKFMNPDKLIVLLGAKAENDTVAPPEKGAASAKRPTRTPAPNPPKKPAGQGGGKNNGTLPEELKKTEFRFKSASAKSVKLVGDFTEWEKKPVEMTHSEDGVWLTVVPLAPGQYSYRFIVDGHWCDDPGSSQRAPNPFGSHNALVHVS